MTCNETKPLLSAYVDGELDTAGSVAIENHVQGCISCAGVVDAARALTRAIESGALRFNAPPVLKTKINKAIRAANPGVKRSLFHWKWATVAASAFVVIFLVWVGGSRWTRASRDSELVNEILSSHVRSMMASHITDVASSDSHTVKPWFGGKLDYSPPAKDLTEQGFRLVGGRLDYVQNRPVAAVVYQRAQHFINLFVWPSSQSPTTQTDQLTIQGYNIIHWTQSDMTFWLISELNLAELNECAKLLME